ncbi:Gfo/Idh/MocA family oxidoreductase [Mucilaginibacter flavidus]|uniref:Gfo/Idh/MocA family oxidoreductase n=1 Tax=Mucilaginibacter flavidus TaxID=2949309 RepID=UPI002092712C|nr:Gfo/Idh/MocA family oxidoreductase [Mucilaginibacter flavidus]MCO5949295.1 Gfo/Idh/MocA family oxidoreductase [Mucilaginibacter flavidus]
MKTNLIIGAGQIGSRHLQGLLNLNMPQTIYVLDPSEQSLEISKRRAEEIPNDHIIRFITDWTSLPIDLDLVIVATGANVRKSVLNILLDGFKVKYLLLEKILFQDVESYPEIAELIQQKAIPVWVNHPRRIFDSYVSIKREIPVDEPVKLHVIGNNWGLGCNGLHFIDLCAFLSGSEVDSINADWIDDELLESKRPGYIEFSGTLKGIMKNGSCFSVSSFKGDLNMISVTISTVSESWVIIEGAMSITYHQKTGDGRTDYKRQSATKFQSQLTTVIASDLFLNGTCDLPTYEEARQSHVPFIKTLLTKYNDLTGIDNRICPIT